MTKTDVEAVLAAHEWQKGYPGQCSCGWRTDKHEVTTKTDHRAHVAKMLAPLSSAVYIVQTSEQTLVASTPEAALRLAEEAVSDYFGRPIEWRKAADIDYWEGQYHDGPHQKGLISITGMEVHT